MKFKVEKNVISELYVNNQNIVFPWGIETADSSSFFSLEDGVGWRYEIVEEDYCQGLGSYKYTVVSQMLEGRWKLQGEDWIENNKIYRIAVLEAETDVFLLDFVLRYRFNKEFFSKACIAGKNITHKNSNVYYQYATDELSLFGEKMDIILRVNEAETTNKMRPELYVRDFNDEWVVHARMLPTYPEKKVIKLCNSWYDTKPLPKKLNDLLCNNDIIYEYLKYHNERTPYKHFISQKINPNAFPLICLKKGEKLKWKVEVEIVEK